MIAMDPWRRAVGLLAPTVRLPVAAGLMVFLVAVGTTQVALQVKNRSTDAQLRQLGEVYLDGLAASVRAGLATRDALYVGQRFDNALREQRGIAERALFAFGPDGALLTRRGDETIAAERAGRASGFAIDAGEGLAWMTREPSGDTAGRLVVALDVSAELAARDRLLWSVVLADLLIATIFALLAYRILRRLNRPIDALVDGLSAGRRGPVPIPAGEIARADGRTAAVLEAFNRMAQGVRERERLARGLADREQLAALGRLSGTIAHEVRNPLAGMAAAVSTLKRFGDDAATRAEALVFLDRGIEALDGIVTSTLNVYRPEQERHLSRADFEDLRRLVRPEADKRGVRLDFDLNLPPELRVGAGGIRQVLLNLLLNACAVTPEEGAVSLRAHVTGGQLRCEITDEGPGLDDARATRLAGGAVVPEADAPASRRLGIDVVVDLLGDLDAQATVLKRATGGTSIELVIPLAEAA